MMSAEIVNKNNHKQYKCMYQRFNFKLNEDTSFFPETYDLSDWYCETSDFNTPVFACVCLCWRFGSEEICDMQHRGTQSVNEMQTKVAPLALAKVLEHEPQKHKKRRKVLFGINLACYLSNVPWSQAQETKITDHFLEVFRH
jgi:hypothetical protein